MVYGYINIRTSTQHEHNRSVEHKKMQSFFRKVAEFAENDNFVDARNRGSTTDDEDLESAAMDNDRPTVRDCLRWILSGVCYLGQPIFACSFSLIQLLSMEC